MVLYILIERVCINIFNGKHINITGEEQCDTCNVESFKENKKVKPKNKCRIVCDDSSSEYSEEKDVNNTITKEKHDIEGFEETKTDYNMTSRYDNMGRDDRYGFGGMFYDNYPSYKEFKNKDYSKLAKKMARDEAREDRIEDRLQNTNGFEGRYQDVGEKSEILRTTDNKRRITGDLDDEIPYTDYNHLPVASGYKSHDYEYGYSFLPPEKWYRQPPRPPICVTQQRSAILPSYTHGAPMDMKEWHSSRRITPPDRINVEYIEDKLNAGR